MPPTAASKHRNQRWIVATASYAPRSPLDAEANYRFGAQDESVRYYGTLRIPCFGYDGGEKMHVYAVYEAEAHEGWAVLAEVLALHGRYCGCDKADALRERYRVQLAAAHPPAASDAEEAEE